jgi:ABC-type uncharacterized transport system substrate-binding protein
MIDRRSALLLGAAALGAGIAPARPAAPFKVLHVMSYHAAWQWNKDQYAAFQDELADVPIDYRVLEMDTKRRSDPAWIKEVSAQATALIDEWRPDLVYTNDDNAQRYVVAPYPEGRTKFVFSAVNAKPETYGFDARSDVTGVMEREHILQTLTLLRDLAPGARRFAVLVDDGATWPSLVARMKAMLAQDDRFEVVGSDTLTTFEDYKRAVAGYQDQVDALGVLGVFTLKDAQGRNTPFEQVLRWTAEHSRLPDFSFWGSRTDLGTLCAVTVSATAQGREAGRMAREILVNGRPPSDIMPRATLKGQPVINLQRARDLGLSPTTTTLLTSRVVKHYAW